MGRRPDLDEDEDNPWIAYILDIELTQVKARLSAELRIRIAHGVPSPHET